MQSFVSALRFQIREQVVQLVMFARMVVGVHAQGHFVDIRIDQWRIRRLGVSIFRTPGQ